MHDGTDKTTAALDGLPYKLLYGVPEVATLLGVHERYVWTLIERGELAAVKLGRLRKIPRADLEAFVADLKKQAQAAREAVA